MAKKKGRNKPPPQGSQPVQGRPVQVTTQAQPSPDDKPQLLSLIRELEDARGNRVIVYWLADTARVSEAVVHSLYDQLAAIGEQPTLDLLLFTRGGDTEIPWRLTSLIREYCDRFAVLVPYRAASAGTLLAMGADEIVMTRLGVLGPIDPSRTHPLLPRSEGATQAEPISVQDMRHAMEFIRETASSDTDAEYTPETMAQIVTALFEHLHPLAIGAIEQSYALAKLIGTRCLESHMDPKQEREEIDAIVNRLCDDYKSHNYQISRQEARSIGLKVVDAPPSVESALMGLLKFYLARPVGGPSTQSVGHKFKLMIGWLDSTDLQFRAELEAEIATGNEIKQIGDRWVTY